MEETLELTPEVIKELKAVAESDQRAAHVNEMITQVTRQLVARFVRRVVDEVRTDPSVLKENRSYSLVVAFGQTDKGEWLSTAEVAEMFQVSQQQVRRWCESGKFRNVRTPGGTYRISKGDVVKGLQSGTEPASRKPDPSEYVGVWANNKTLVEEIREASEDRDNS
ncbi:MAG: helix-turn-helix domain-containing protein [Thermaerobacter sp.]|nr:helix-turn-helix domain-containing protein [Thermaerobacter sp.]